MILKINFVDFWKSFNKADNYFTSLLSTKYTLEISENPDVLFFSVFGNDHKKYSCLKIFYTGEFYEPNLSIADLSLSFSRVNDKRNYRYPLYIPCISI